MRKLIPGTLIGLAAALVAGLVGLLPFVDTIEKKTYDWRIRQTAEPEHARRDIVMVAIDESSITKLAPVVGRWPWPRLVHSVLLDFLSRAPAKVIVYDVIFAEPDTHSFTIGGDSWTGAESDQALVDATARAGNVVHVADVVAESSGDAASGPPPVTTPYRLQGPVERRTTLVPPFPALAKASRALGHNLLVLDPDGPVRRVPPFVDARGQFIPSLPLAAAMILDGTAPSTVRAEGVQLALGDRRRIPLLDMEVPDFYGKPQAARRMLVRFPGGVLNDNGKPTFADYSFYDLFYSEQQLQAGEKPVVDPATFRDAVVFVGTTAPGLSDLFTVPFPGKMPGMQVHASALDSILRERFLAPAPRWLDLLVLLLPAVLAGAALSGLGVWRGLAVTSVVLVGLVLASVSLFAGGTWIRLVDPALALAVAAFGGVGYHYLVEGREKRKVKHLFSRYVSKDVCEQLMANPALARLGGQRREMSVLFSDIRGFTTFSEQGSPEEIVSQLNEYFSRMVQVVFDHRGTLDKFVGDAVMALFGAPLDDPDHADHAVQAALKMLAELDDLNRLWAAQGRPTLDIGIGVNTGEMVAGNIGSTTIMSYTVIGDAVNLGSRLESLNKQHGTHIIISESTRARLKGRYDMRGLGDVVVKGKTQPVAIYEVVA